MSEEELELVINGDIVDFLVQDDYPNGLQSRMFTDDQDEVIHKLAHIFERTKVAQTPSGDPRGVLDALRDLLQAGVHLTLLLGNHDVELALPKVRSWLIGELGGPSKLLRFFYDGEAYSAGRLLVEHGNRYDRWNQIDHSALRQERSMLSRGLKVEESLRSRYYFVPPAGTHLVIHMMNRIKDRYRFVDLLKPEEEAVLPLLLALEPDYLPELDAIVRAVPLGCAYTRHGLQEAAIPRRPGDLAAEEAGEGILGELRRVLGPDVHLFFRGSPTSPVHGGDLAGTDEESLLYRIKRWWKTGLSALVARKNSLAQLGGIWLAWDNDQDRLRKLHRALCVLSKGNTAFVIEKEQPRYLDAARQTASAGGFQVVAYGHSHLPKKVVEKTFTYLNSGTWADVIRIPEFCGEFDKDRETLEIFLSDMKENQLDGHIQRYLSYLEVALKEDGSVYLAELRSYGGPGKERAAPLTSYGKGPHGSVAAQ